jgi:hypothetical protein
MEMVMFSKGVGMVKFVGGQVMNIMSASKNKEGSPDTGSNRKMPRKSFDL